LNETGEFDAGIDQRLEVAVAADNAEIKSN
jgi:hypothetical protein